MIRLFTPTSFVFLLLKLIFQKHDFQGEKEEAGNDEDEDELDGYGDDLFGDEQDRER